MTTIKQVILWTFLISFLAGCAETKPLKAPCNWSGSNCWPRTKINEWDANHS